MEAERTPVVPADRLLEVAGVLSEGASRLHRQLERLPPAERRALLEVVVGQVGDIVRSWAQLVQAGVLAGGDGHAPDSAEPAAAPALAPLRPGAGEGGGAPGAGGALLHDELTGVLNRQAGWAALAREVERARAEGVRYLLGYLNVDGLGRLNEAEGPRAGDELLRKVAAALRATLRSYDVIVRLQGDEFLFALPGADLATAEQRMRELNALLGEEAPGASVSVGFAELRQGESLDELVVRADEALVQARRRRGRPRLR